MEKILITGVAGFIGSHVASRFLKEGFQVVGIDDLSGGKKENIPSGVEFIRGDLADKATMKLIPAGCTIILHLAGQSSGEISFDDPVADLEKNTVSTLNLIQYALENKSNRIVYASSMSVYGGVEDAAINESHTCKPLSCYGVGKYASEAYLRIYNNKLPSVIMRMFNVYGPGQDMSNMRQGMVSVFMAQAVSTKKIEVKGSTERFRDFIFIDDVVEAWFRAATYDSALGQVINIGTGIKTTVGNLLERICSSVPGSSFYVQGSTPGDQSGIFADNSKIKNCLKMEKFVSLDEGIKFFSDWALKNHK